MKRVIQFIFLCCIGLQGYSQSMEEIIFPKYVYYSDYFQGGFITMPYIFKAKLTGLQPSATYRYFAGIGPASSTDYYDFGSTASIMMKPSGDITSLGYPPYSLDDYLSDGFGFLTADAQGTYTGWFAVESHNFGQIGQPFRMAVNLNDGAEGTYVTSAIISNLTVTGLNIGQDELYNGMEHGTGIRSTATGASPNNIVFLYDNAEGTGRPVSSAFVQSEGLLSVNESAYSGFYKDNVYSKVRTWGTVIPKELPSGIRRIEQYSFITDALVGFNTSPDGMWDGPDGSLVSTVNPTGGTNEIVIDGSLHNLVQDRTAQTISFGPLPDKTYGDAPFGLTATSSAGLTGFTFSSSDPTVASIAGNIVTIHKPGTITITVIERGNSTYNHGIASQSLTVNPAGQMISFDPLPAKTYGDAAISVNPTASSGLPVSLRSSDENIASVNGHTITIRKAGTVDIIASQAGNGNFPAAPEETRTLVIAKAALTITADAKSKAAGEANPVLTFQYSGFQYKDNPDSLEVPLTITTTADASSEAGTYPIILGGAESGNYTITLVNAVLSVFAETQTVQFSLAPQTYGDAAFDPAATSTTGATPVYSSSNPRVAVITPEGKVQITGAGTAYITAKFPAADNLPFTTKDQLLTVTKADLTLTPEHKTRKYGAADPVFTASYTGLQYEDERPDLLKAPIFQTNATAGSGTGDYTITASGAVSENYEIHYGTGVLTIEKALLTATPDNTSRPYGVQNPVFTVSYTGFANGENSSVINTPATASSIATQTTGIGDYPITAGGAADDNYEFAYADGTLTITIGARTIDFAPLPMVSVGDEDRALNGTISSGEQLSYTSSNTNVATIVNGMIHIVGAGKARITATAPANPNFGTDLPSVERTLVVNKGEQTISFGGLEGILLGEPMTLSITANSGLPVTLSLSDSSLADLNGNKLTPLHAGTLRIIASQEGNEEWQAVSVVKEIKLVDKSNLEAWTSGRTTVEMKIFTQKAQKVAIRIFSLNGKKVYSTEKQFSAGMNQQQLIIGNVPAGIYILHVQGETMKADQKIWIR